MMTDCCDLQGFVHLLSRHIGCDIKRLARALNAESTYVELERQYPRDLKEIIRLFFERWQRAEGEHASVNQLMRGLKAAELMEVSTKMEAYIQGGVSCRAFIKELSRHIGFDFMKLARALNVDKTDLDAIEFRDPRDLKEQIVQFFKFWEEREGSRASIETLMAGLKKEELSEVVEKMELFLKQVSPSPSTVMCQVAHDGDVAETKLTLLPQQKTSYKHSIVKTESCRDTTSARLMLPRGRSSSDSANWHSARPQKRSSNLYRTPKSIISTCNETEIQLPFFCPNSVTLYELQCLVKGTDTHIQTLCTHPSSGYVRALISGNTTCCCEVFSEYLKEKLYNSQNIVSKLVTIENRHQWVQVYGLNGCINKAIKSLSGSDVWIENLKDYPKPCHVTGLPEQVKMAEELLRRAMQGDDIVKEATAENILSRIKKELVQFCSFQFESMA